MCPQPLGSMPKDSYKMVANWLVKLLEFMPGSAVARGGIISIGCGLNGNYSGVSKPKSSASG
jgi:hypothetical protein